MRNFIKIADSVKFGISNSYIISISNVNQGMSEAIGFAKTINCEKESGCGICATCSKIDRKEHSDIAIIPDDSDDISEFSNIKIESIRALKEVAFRRPFEGKYRVFIIRHADRMTEQAQNSFLKILEEPPINSVFLLITNNVFGLLSTIRSRCRQFNYPYNKQFNIDYKDKINDLAGIASGQMDMFFSYTQKVSKDKDALLEFLDFLIIMVRDVLSLQCGHTTITGMDNILRQLKFQDIEGTIDELNRYYSFVKNRNINKELIAINALNLAMNRK